MIVLIAAACDHRDPAIEMLPSSVVKAVEIEVNVARTGCTIKHLNGGTATELRIPADTPVTLVLSSLDGDHDVALGSRGMLLHVTRHYSYALIEVHDSSSQLALECPDGVATAFTAVPFAQYEAYLVHLGETSVPTTPEAKVALGRTLYNRKGCVACHTIDGSPRIGPSWRGIWGTTARLADGTQRIVDAAYVRASILAPQAFARPGFPPSMPSFEGQLREHELESITAFIASLAAKP